jgi:biopolymer transport protein ExbD
MAEISQQGGGGSKDGKVRAKKASTKIDMTPMVDLAFLLLTFFMLTTTFNKPQTMEVTMPEKEFTPEDQTQVNERNVLSIVLGDNDKVYWFMGITEPKVEVTSFAKDGIRKVLVEKNAENPTKLIVLIKPMDVSRYKNVVDILDEMAITETKRFALIEATPEDEELIKASETQPTSSL